MLNKVNVTRKSDRTSYSFLAQMRRERTRYSGKPQIECIIREHDVDKRVADKRQEVICSLCVR